AGVFVLFGVQTKAAALAILSLNSLFSALTCFPVFFIAKRTLGLRVAKLAIWLWAFFPYAIYFSADSTWDHSLLALMTPTLFLISLHLEDAAGIWPWIGFGLFYGVATLTSPVVLAVLPVLLGWPCYRRWRAGGSYSLSGFSAVLALLVITVPWIVRNYRTFGHLVFFKDNLWVEVCVGNIGNSLHWWNGEFHPAGSEAEAKAFGDLGESAYVAAKRQQALAFLEQHPAKFVEDVHVMRFTIGPGSGVSTTNICCRSRLTPGTFSFLRLILCFSSSVCAGFGAITAKPHCCLP